MSRIITLITVFFCLSLFAQEPALVPVAPADDKKAEEKKAEEKKEEEKKKEEKKEGYQDLYQQYLNKYNQDQTQTAPAENKTEVPAQTVAEPAPVPVQAADNTAPVQVVEKVKEPEPVKEVVPIAPFSVKPYFYVQGFGSFSNGVKIFGTDTLSSSWKFALDNAIIDMKGGNKMFDGRILLDFAKGLDTEKVVEINYDHDSSLPTDSNNPLETEIPQNQPNALDILEDVSFKLTHPSVRKGGFGMNVDLQAGKFTMPFGLETLYANERTFTNNSYMNDVFMSDGFNDLGFSLGADFLLSNEMDLGIKFFLFNGSNENLLDAQDKFKDPAFGFDIRYNYKKDFYATAAVSFIFGSAYHDYNESIKDGIFKTTNNTYLDESTMIEENLITKEDFIINKKNILLAIGLDLGYNFNKNISLGLMTQFVLSHRDIFNPLRKDADGNTHIDSAGVLNDDGNGDPLRFLRDGSTNFWGSSNYTTWGLFAAPYAKVYMFDILARISYNKAPFLYNFLEDSNNSTLAFDLDIIYNFSDYGSLALTYTFVREVMNKYDAEYNDLNGLSEFEYLQDTFNHNSIMLNLCVNYDFLWEKN